MHLHVYKDSVENELSGVKARLYEGLLYFWINWMNLKVNDNDLLTNFDVVSLYKKEYVMEVVDTIRMLTKTKLVEFFLFSTYFTFQNQIYE